MGFALRYLPHYTYEDYLQWEGRWELIDGIPYAMAPSPNFDHQSISMELSQLFYSALRNCNKCKVLPALDWKIRDDMVLCPDVFIVCEPYERGNFLSKAPVLVLEILSVSTAKKDRTLKYDIYEGQGVKYYVIAHPKKQIIEIYELIDGEYQKVFEAKDGSFDFNFGECKAAVDFMTAWE